MFTEYRRRQAVDEIDGVLSLTNVARNAVFLDLGCGHGRHVLDLARRGYEVVGLDGTQIYLDRAKQLARDQGLNARFIHADLRADLPISAYDCVISFFSTFGYFENHDDDLLVLRNVRRALKPGGMLLMELVGKEILARHFEESEAHEIDERHTLIEAREVVDDWEAIESTWTIITDTDAKVLKWKARIFSAREIKGLIRAAGFDAVSCYGNFLGAPYNHDATQLIVCAKVA